MQVLQQFGLDLGIFFRFFRFLAGMHHEVRSRPALGADQPVDCRLRFVVDHGSLAAGAQHGLFRSGPLFRVVIVLIKCHLVAIDRLAAHFLLEPRHQLRVLLHLVGRFQRRADRDFLAHILASLKTLPFWSL